MGLSQSIAFVGDKLVVGQADFSDALFVPPIPGTSVLNGPVWIGSGQPLPTANCMIGPGLNPVSLEVKGISNFLGPITNIAGLLQVTAVSNFTGSVNIIAVETKNGADLKNAVNIGNDTGIFNGPVTINAPLNVTGQIFCGSIDAAAIKATFGAFSSVAAPFKFFEIPHPNKNGMRLRHACLEGPEHGVYFRGKLKDQSKIVLPDYWRGLIDPETITVHLTPHQSYQELFVKNIEWGSIINIANNSSGPIDCSYIVYAERKDVDKLIIEYEDGEN